jgi:hypothetical protein
MPIKLDSETFKALATVAKQDFRDPQQEAVVLLRLELERRGVLGKNQSAHSHKEIVNQEANNG